MTLSQDLPFTFVDHALKCGDSLVGYSLQEIEAASEAVQLLLLRDQKGTYVQACVNLRRGFTEDTLDDASYDRKKQQLQQQIQAGARERLVGDLMVAAFFAETKPAQRANALKQHLSYISGAFVDHQLPAAVQEILNRLTSGDKGITPFHWDLEFPEVFGDGRGGFDVFVGNPPFAGKNTIAEGSPDGILDWFKQLHPESHGNADLVAHFFRRCFDLIRPQGSLGLIATNTIAQGDTRSSGLRWICLNGGTIYAARKRTKWPGVAAVVVSMVHILKGVYEGVKLMEKRPAEQISAFLFAKGGHDDPKQLAANAGMSFQGSKIYGQGFTFDDSGLADEDTPGIPSPIATMERLITENPRNAEVIFPYIGGEEVNSSPTHVHHRYVINFGERHEEECQNSWPDLTALACRKVRPERDRLQGTADATRLKQRWWVHGRSRQEMYESIVRHDRVLVTALHQPNWQLAFMESDQVFSHALAVLSLSSAEWIALLHCRAHEVWARFLGSSMKDDLRYTPSDCFETFPFPAALLDSATNDPAHESTRQSLEAIGERYHQFRAELMIRNNEGLTSTYNRFHDPAETSPALLELRALHTEMDQAVLAAYGWSDALTQGIADNPHHTPCGFGLDYLDLEDDIQLTEQLQERIDEGNLFFWDAGDALDFQGQLRAAGAVKAKKRLPWRYRWPDSVRDDILARLLALNAERYAEEVAMGLHSKGAKQVAKTTSTRKTKPASSAEFQLTSEPYQTGLQLF